MGFMAQFLHAKPGPALGWLPAAAALALSGIALAGCGHAAATDTGTGVCAYVSRIDRLTIHRVNGFPQNHLHFTVPAHVTVSSARQAQAVARALCSLPAMPSGPMSCGSDLGVSYRLHFATSARKLPLVKVGAGGCDGVSGLGQTRWTARTPSFWGVLGRAAGIDHASFTTFGGTFPS